MDICPVIATGAVRVVDFVLASQEQLCLAFHVVTTESTLPLFWSYWSDQAILTCIGKPDILENV